MEHNHHHHDHEPPASLKNLLFAMVINGGIVVFEMIFGLLIQCMALISDDVPPDTDYEEVLTDLKAIPSVMAVHDLHIWQSGGA